MLTETSPEILLEIARGYTMQKISVVPIDRNGRPLLSYWESFQSRIATDAELCKWFANEAVWGLAVVTGKISGGLVIMEFKDTNFYARWYKNVRKQVNKYPIQRTPDGRVLIFIRKPKPSRKISGILLNGGNRIQEIVAIHADGSYCIVSSEAGEWIGWIP